ncbi:MAG: TolC family protein [Gemmatimonadaceae bacterium]|nr:TolC family protein [Gemmatimonadaceae bacterium]
MSRSRRHIPARERGDPATGDFARIAQPEASAMYNPIRALSRRRPANALRVALLLALPVGASAQQSMPPVLRLGDLYRVAERSSPRLGVAREIARAAEARIPGSRRPPDPQLQLGWMNYSLPGLRPMAPLGMTQLQLMQMIPVAGKLRLAGRAASWESRAAAERVGDARWEARTQVAMAFYDLYRTDRSLEVADETRRLVADIARAARSMYAVGSGSQADVLRAQVEIARMDEDIVRMRAMRSAMAARLAVALTIEDTSFATPALPAFPEALPSLDSLQRLALAERPMLRAGAAELRAADASTALADREIWPDVTVGVQYGQQRGEMGTERMGSLMIGASIPVFARSRQLAMRDEAQAMRAMAAADLDAMRAETRGRVAERYADLLRARRLLALYETTILPQAQAAVTSALASYRVGGTTFMALLDDQMTVNRYRQESYALRAEQGKALAELEMLVGRELVDADSVQPVDVAASAAKGVTP